MNIYAYTHYREIVRSLVLEKRSIGQDLSFEKLANRARISKAYFSRVLSGKAQFSSDQLFLVCEALELPDQDRDWLCLLLEYDQTAVKTRKNELKKKVESIRKERMKTENYLTENQTLPEEYAQRYYLDPWLAVVHICLETKKFEENPKSLASHLSLNEDYLYELIETLRTIGLVTIDRGKVKTNRSSTIHISESSALFPQWRRSIRSLSQSYMDSRKDQDSYTFSAIFTASKSDQIRIRNLFLDFLGEVRKISNDSPSEAALQMNFDLFKWF